MSLVEGTILERTVDLFLSSGATLLLSPITSSISLYFTRQNAFPMHQPNTYRQIILLGRGS